MTAKAFADRRSPYAWANCGMRNPRKTISSPNAAVVQMITRYLASTHGWPRMTPSAEKSGWPHSRTMNGSHTLTASWPRTAVITAETSVITHERGRPRPRPRSPAVPRPSTDHATRAAIATPIGPNNRTPVTFPITAKRKTIPSTTRARPTRRAFIAGRIIFLLVRLRFLRHQRQDHASDVAIRWWILIRQHDDRRSEERRVGKECRSR